jgi:hypothetical protein
MGENENGYMAINDKKSQPIASPSISTTDKGSCATA